MTMIAIGYRLPGGHLLTVQQMELLFNQCLSFFSRRIIFVSMSILLSYRVLVEMCIKCNKRQMNFLLIQ